MIVICEECGKKYQVKNVQKIREEGASFNCKKCKNLIRIDGISSVSSDTPDFQEPFFEMVKDPEPDTSFVETITTAEPFEKEAQTDTTEKKGMRFGLVPKAVMLLLFVSLLPVALLWFVSFKDTSEKVRVSLENEMAAISKGLVGSVDGWIGANVRAMNAMTQLEGIQSMDAFQQEPILKAIQKEYPWTYLIFTVGPNGMNIARNDGKALRDYSDRQYYKDVMAGKRLAWQNLIGKTSKKPALVLAVPIRRNGKLVGVLGNAMTVDDISKEVATWKRGKSGNAFLIDEKGKVVAHQNPKFTIEQKNLSKHPLIADFKGGHRGSLEFVDPDGTKSVGYARNTNYGWVLALQQDQDEAYADLYQSQKFSYVLLGVTFLFVLFIASISARKMAKPIVELTEVADKISVGQLDVEIVNKRKDELGDLMDAIGRMQESIQLSIQRLRKRQRF